MTGQATGLFFHLVLPYERPFDALTANKRPHWTARAKATKQLREDVVTLAKAAGLHKLGPAEHITVTYTWAPGDRRRRDADNLWPMLKTACDALARGKRKATAKVQLVGLDLVPDDTPQWMTKNAPVILPPPEPPGMYLDLVIRYPARELGGCT